MTITHVKHFPLVILAGGRSSRMSGPKGLVIVEGRPWLETQLDRFQTAEGGRAMVVLGHHAKRYIEEIPWLESALELTGTRRGTLTVTATINEMAHLGQFSSLQSGLRALTRMDKELPGCFIQPIDVPLPSSEVFKALAHSYCPDISAAVALYDGRKGHPVLVTTSLITQILALDPAASNARLDFLLDSLEGGQIRRIALDDPSIKANLNTPEDWEGIEDRGAPSRNPRQ